jgi:hypothetical protein
MNWTPSFRAIFAAMAMLMLASVVQAAELVMYRSEGCPWCAAWDEAIGPIYPKTEFGRRAPLRMASLNTANSAGVTLQRPVRYSPTFVLADDGREVGRIEGYPGENFFWGLLRELVLKLPDRKPPS